MPKGQQPKIKGAICNVPVRADNVVESFPHGCDSGNIIFVKLKRKLKFTDYVLFESVRPNLIGNTR